MATTFSLFYLGVAPEIDTVEGNVTSENHTALNGLVFGSAGSPLAYNLQTLSPISFSGGNAAAYDADNATLNETFSIDGGAAQTHDTTMLYNSTVITYTDGTTAVVNAIVMQDTAGNLYLLPPTVANTYSTALEAKPIQSVTLGTAAPANGTDTYGMTADRYVLTVSDYTVEGTAGNDFINSGYAGDPEGDFVDATDHIDGTNNDSVEAGAGNDTVLSGAGNDTVRGGDGNDSLLGEAGNDSLVGESGNDTLIGGAGADTLEGGIGLDFADYSASGSGVSVNLTTGTGSGGDAAGDSYAGMDGIIGSAFDDTLVGYDGELLTGGPDDYTNVIDGGAGNDFIDGMAGSDSLFGGSGNDTVIGGAGNDSILGGTGNDTLDGGIGDDTIFGQDGSDTILGGDGNDSLDGDDAFAAGGADSIDGGTGNDTIIGDAGNDTLLDGSGADSVFAGDGADSIVMGTGNDIHFGEADNDTFSARDGFGTDTVVGGETTTTGTDFDRLDFSQITTGGVNVTYSANEAGTATEGANSVSFTEIESVTLTTQADTVDASASTTGVTIDGLAGNDTILGGLGNDTLLGGDGDDSVDDWANDSADSIEGGAGDDTIRTGLGADTVLGGDGNDLIVDRNGFDEFWGGAGNDTLDGGASSDTLYGGTGDDVLIGGGGSGSNDSLFGEDGADTLFGGVGNDLVDGGADADTFVIEDGFGTDTVIGGETTTTGTDFDTLDFSQITTGGVNVTYSANEAGTATEGANSVAFTEIEAVTLTNQADTVDASASTVGVTIDGLAGNDSLTGGSANDTILGGDGFDTIRGGAGNDSLSGGTGNDTVYGDAGADTIDGGADYDRVLYHESATAVNIDLSDGLAESGGDAQGDVLLNVEFVAGSQLDDTLVASASGSDFGGNGGDDLMIGGAGNDRFWGGFDNDTLSGGGGADLLDGQDGDDTFVLANGFGNDTIIGGETQETNGDTLDLSAVTTATTIDLTNANPETGTISDGTSTATFSEIETITLGSGTDTLVLANGGGSDTVSGFAAPIDNGDGTFTGQDQLDVSGLTDALGNPVNVADVVVTDTNGDGTGDAILTFPDGTSITLTGVLASQVDDPAELEAMGIPAVGAVDGTAGDDVMAPGHADAQGDQIDGTDGLDDTIFGNGGNDSITAGAGNDTVHGGDGADTLIGQDGNDLVFGEAGNDSIRVSAGNDTVDAGIDNDTVIVTESSGTSVIDGGLGTDTIDFATELELSGWTITATGDGAGTGTHSSASTVTYSNFETILGSSNDDLFDLSADINGASAIADAGNDTLIGGIGDDNLRGREGDDSLVGGTGADTLSGDADNDTLLGGAGADSILGGDGDDSFVLENGFGNDTIVGGELAEANGDTLDLSSVTTATTIDLTNANPEAGTVSDGTFTATFSEIETITLGSGTDTLVLANGGGSDTVAGFAAPIDNGDGTFTGQDQLDVSGLTDALGNPVDVDDVIVSDTNGDGTGDAILIFPDGTAITLTGVLASQVGGRAELEALGIPGAVDGTAGGDVMGPGFTDGNGDQIDGTDGIDDTIHGHGGDDLIDGDLGSDTIFGGAGNDTLLGGSDGGADLLDGGTGNDELSAGDGDDTLLGGDGTDSLFAGAGDDTLSGGIGSDTLDGWSGNDTIDGGAGDDLITGSDGTDTFVYTAGDGLDTITDFNFGNSGTLSDGDATNNDVIDLSGFYDDIWELQDDHADDGILNQSNAGALIGDTFVDYSDNTQFASGEGIVFLGQSSDGNSFTVENTAVACFTAETRIATVRGLVRALDLQVGDRVLTRDNGYQALRWVGSRRFDAETLQAAPHLRPVSIPAGALGASPHRDMLLSPQHRLLIDGPETELWFGEDEVLLAAQDLTVIDEVKRVLPEDGVTYVHILCDRHELVLSDGHWTESFQPGDLSLAGFDAPQREELFAIFPELRSVDGRDHWRAARPCLRSHQARVLLSRR